MSTLPPLPYIALEVAERIIDQFSGHVDSLRGCALTCRGWLPRARYHLMASIRIQTREDLYSVCDYISANTRMSSAVWSLSMSPAASETNRQGLLEVVPVDLLRRLPNLRRYNLVAGLPYDSRVISFHPTTLNHFKTYLFVEELHLAKVDFRTGAELARVLIALPRLRRLKCDTVEVKEIGTGIARFCDKCGRLSEVTVLGSSTVISGTAGLLVQMSLSVLNVLRYIIDEEVSSPRSQRPPELSQLVHLQFLELICWPSSIEYTFDKIVPILTMLTPPRLRNLTISFLRLPKDQHISSRKRSHPLESAILAIGTPTVVVLVPTKRNHLAEWSKSISSHLSGLDEVGLLEVRCSAGDHLGHDAGLTAIAVSPDSRYVATGASDGTVNVWRRTTTPAYKFLLEIQCHEQSSPQSLEFSSTGEFLSGMCEHAVLIWRVVDGIQTTSLAAPQGMRVITCAWRQDILGSLTLIGTLRTHAILGFPYVTTITPAQVKIRTGVHDDDSHVVVSPSVVLDKADEVGFPIIAESPSGRFVAAGPIGRPYSPGALNICRRTINSTCDDYESHQLSYPSKSRPDIVIFAGDELLIAGTWSGRILWWDISSLPLVTTESSGALDLIDPSNSHQCGIHNLYMSPLCSILVAVCNPALMDDSDGSFIAVLRRTDNFRVRGCLNAGFEPPHAFLRGHTKSIDAACFSPCDRYIATGSEDTTVRVWSSRDGELLWTFLDHDAPVTVLVFSPDGQFLVSGDNDGEFCTHYLPMFVRDALRSTVISS